VQAGGGFVGVASAWVTNTAAGWPWYDRTLVGTIASSVAPETDAEMVVSDRVHPSTLPLPVQWPVHDSIPNFRDHIQPISNGLQVGHINLLTGVMLHKINACIGFHFCFPDH
jgi:Trehalose utilisation